MSEIAIEFDGVWKKFKKGELHDSLRDLIPSLTRVAFSRNGQGELHEREFWALRDISFQIRRGEACGIVGANGAGKSTILKLLSKILRANKGAVNIHGKVSGLIEVGAGFHPDLTGRENVYLNGCILGMKRHEVARKFDQIVEFAGVGEFIDTPVKRYSSGMYARLGFAVAAHVDPDILLVDEVLSVGDMQFQEKCLDRMREVVGEGTTVIFVSHNLQAVQTLCKQTVLLKTGTVSTIGPTAKVLTGYLCEPSAGASSFPTLIENITLHDVDGLPKANFSPGEKARLNFTVHPSEQLKDCQLGLLVHRATDGLAICDYNLPLSQVAAPTSTAIATSFVAQITMNLLRGAYVVSLHIYHAPTARYIARAYKVANFFVEETLSWQGVTHLEPSLSFGQELITQIKHDRRYRLHL